MDELTQIAGSLGDVYYEEKLLKGLLSDERKQFFDAITAKHDNGSLAQKTVEVPDDIHADESESYVTRYNPGWRIVADTWQVDDDAIRVVVEEDPAFIGDTILVEEPVGQVKANGDEVEHPGYKISKTIRHGSATLDDERLILADYDLYESVTEEPWWAQYVPSRGGGDIPRTLRTDLSAKEQQSLAPYIYESAWTAALNVNYAKDSDF